MTLSERIKILCVRAGISVAELSRRVGKSAQNFNGRMKKESFTIAELEEIAKAVGCTYENYFIWTDGNKI